MAIGAVDVAGPEGAGRIKGQMHLQGTAGEPGAGALEGRPLHDPEAKQVLIEGERPWQIGDDEINMVERKLSHGRRLTQWLAKATRQLLQENGQSTPSQQSNPIMAAGPRHR